jgi:hypothetical protein
MLPRKHFELSAGDTLRQDRVRFEHNCFHGQMGGFCRFSQRITNIVDCLLEGVELEPSGDFLNGQ